MTNQSEEILNYIKSHPHCSTENIVSGTGWNRHLVEVAVKLMVEQGLVKEMGQTDWLDFRDEAIERPTREDKTIEELRIKIDNLMSKIHEDLQLSVPGRLFSNISLPKMAVGLMGFPTVEFPGLTSMINESIEQNRLLEEVAYITSKTTDEVKDFYQTHLYSLEFIKAAIQAGAKLDEEDIKRTMEERAIYRGITDFSSLKDISDVIMASAKEDCYTFLVTLPNSERREVKAAYMKVDGATLYFKDEDDDTILAFGPGHWVWAERKEEDEQA